MCYIQNQSLLVQENVSYFDSVLIVICLRLANTVFAIFVCNRILSIALLVMNMQYAVQSQLFVFFKSSLGGL